MQRRLLLVGILALFGAATGIALTLAAGTVCSDGVSESFCGLNFLVWNLSSVAAVTLSTALGAVVGGVLGLVVSLVFFRRSRAV
jgi:hypothetical protein